MNLIYTVLLAFPIGFLVADRQRALLWYLVPGSFLFTFQTAELLLEFLAHEGRSAFGESPTGLPITMDHGEVFGYGAVNLVICLVGVGLTLAGVAARARRARRRDGVVADPAAVLG